MTLKPDGYNSIMEEKRHLRCKVPQKMKNLTPKTVLEFVVL
jgi:hypothetical protein